MSGSRKVLPGLTDAKMVLQFDFNDYLVMGGALLLLVLISYFLREKFSAGQRYLTAAIALTAVINPLLLICFYAKILFFAQSYPRTVLNSWGYLQAVSTISVLCEVMAVYLVYLLYSGKTHGSALKTLTMLFCINGAVAALCLLEAPKLVWPLSFASVTGYSLPALIAFALINFAVYLYSIYLLKKAENS